MPSVKMMVEGIHNLPNSINLPTSGGSFLNQPVEYIGLPNQCCIGRGMGHIAKDCSHAHKKITTYNS